LILAVSAQAMASDASSPAVCPGYTDHLRVARELLRRGDRDGAVRELRRAKEALEHCVPDRQNEIGLSARDVPDYPG
jgi:hypothetical protein